jgi:hypothetical protein
MEKELRNDYYIGCPSSVVCIRRRGLGVFPVARVALLWPFDPFLSVPESEQSLPGMTPPYGLAIPLLYDDYFPCLTDLAR